MSQRKLTIKDIDITAIVKKVNALPGCPTFALPRTPEMAIIERDGKTVICIQWHLKELPFQVATSFLVSIFGDGEIVVNWMGWDGAGQYRSYSYSPEGWDDENPPPATPVGEVHRRQMPQIWQAITEMFSEVKTHA